MPFIRLRHGHNRRNPRRRRYRVAHSPLAIFVSLFVLMNSPFVKRYIAFRKPAHVLTHTVSKQHSFHLQSDSDFQLGDAMQHVLSHNITQCSHSVLFSTLPRGSTWFLANVERCRYNASCTTYSLEQGGQFNTWDMQQNETWNRLTVQQMASHLKQGGSLNIFPTMLKWNEWELKQLLRTTRVPVFLLARGTKNLRGVVKLHSPHHPRNDFIGNPSLEEEQFFKRTRHMLSAVDRMWDEFDYEHVWAEKVIVAQSAQCYVLNCNFA